MGRQFRRLLTLFERQSGCIRPAFHIEIYELLRALEIA